MLSQTLLNFSSLTSREMYWIDIDFNFDLFLTQSY